MEKNLIPVPARQLLDLCDWDDETFDAVEKFHANGLALTLNVSDYVFLNDLDKQMVYVTPEALHELDHLKEDTDDQHHPCIEILSKTRSEVTIEKNTLHINLADDVTIQPHAFAVVDTRVFVLCDDQSLRIAIGPSSALQREFVFTLGKITPDNEIIVLLYNYTDQQITLSTETALVTIYPTKLAEVEFRYETVI